MNYVKRLAINNTIQRVVFSIVLTYVITALHHAYGAWLYDTPWRNHIVSQGVLWLLVCLVFLFVYKAWNQKWCYWVFFVLSFFFFFGAIGMYEGMYNHLLKNLLYYGELPESMLLRLYPPPKYEMPNDLLFETTGILSFMSGVFSGYVMIQYSYFIILKRGKIKYKK
jgi:hypothetical protein